ncbi:MULTISPECIES: enoyl-CoA hydratase/isomerase family protein [Arsenicicoccus]|uniref:enoyl-CoA hydratase/isomerase family protein n=1 Tax=Arsenicicoccus TaxID=267408 RepID=UPI00257B0864|nr:MULTISPECIES: enoyl-CoA hydratase/isomerase family protein [Actinomycetes]
MELPGTFEHVRYAVASGVAQIVLARPERRNVLGVGPGSSRTEILQALLVADHDDAVGCILLHAEGDAFCGGGDLTGAALPEGIDGDLWLVTQVDDFHARVRAVSKPVVVAVQGSCLGAGLGMIVQADLVLAGDDARFGLPEGRFGHPGGAELAAVVGASWAKFLIFTGETIGAQQAVECGLALAVIPREMLLTRALDLAQRIATMPPTSLRLNKRAIDAAVESAGRAAGRVAGRAVDVLTKSASHAATAPDGRRFEDIVTAQGVRGLRTATAQQVRGSWLDSVAGDGGGEQTS